MSTRLPPHVFPGAVLDGDEGSSLQPIDLGVVRGCLACNVGHVHRINEPDEKPDGSFLGYVHLECCICHEEPREAE